MKFITNNFFLKLLSLAFAILIYYSLKR